MILPRVDILMITCNRPRYTALSLRRLLDTCERGTHVWVWQNGDDPETSAVVSSVAAHPRIGRIMMDGRNRGLREPTNWFWAQSDATLFAKVDDDCLVSEGWIRALAAAHAQAPRLGLIACWHFLAEDFDPTLAGSKIQTLPEGPRLLRNCWVQGSGYLMKRDVFDQLGPMREAETFTDYGIRAALAGWINGWRLPLIPLEHMDDPRSPHSRFTSDEEFVRHRPLSAINHGVYTLEDWKRRVRSSARSVQQASCDPRQYVGWRRRWRRARSLVRRTMAWGGTWQAGN